MGHIPWPLVVSEKIFIVVSSCLLISAIITIIISWVPFSYSSSLLIFLDVQIYILYLFLHSNYKIVYRNILLGVFFHMFSCCCIHHIPLCFYTYFRVLISIFPQIYIYHYFPTMGIFLFSLWIGRLFLFFVLCLVFVSVF